MTTVETILANESFLKGKSAKQIEIIVDFVKDSVEYPLAVRNGKVVILKE